ncbi:phospholipase D family protein [Microbacterium sp. Mu-80]|uniref:Phospholipase D family protein n=1 Tax=Microbacterium bandirmense TaxID=3122050 RepID=A0ABU8LD04_9MICO
MGVLSAVRQAVDRVDVFAQSGYISLGASSDLVTVLEPMIHPVTTRRGLFHPKAWFLEFANGDERRYRFVCSSRNLTTDRTWDAVVSLDGTPGDQPRPVNDGMVQLLGWLADEGRSTPRLADPRGIRIRSLADAWRTIEWEHPDHVRRLNVHVLGVGSNSLPQLEGTRALVVSPFVTGDGLARVRARRGGETTLVSRPDQLEKLAPAILHETRIRVLDDFVDQALADADTDADTPDEPRSADLTGLHAKIVVHDRAGGGSTMLIGSANATTPAWTTNVEVMVEVQGPTKQFGVGTISEALAPLLDDFVTDGGVAETADEVAERELDDALRRIAQTRVSMRVMRDDPYAVEVWAEEEMRVPKGFIPSWRLLTQREFVTSTIPAADQPHTLGSMGLEQVTPFVVVSLSDAVGRRQQTIVIAEVYDDVPGRADAIVASHLTEPGAFARFVRLLLFPQDATALSEPGSVFTSFHSAFGAGVAEDGSGLMELLVRAAATNHQGLTEIERVLRHFSPEESAQALPEGFASVWESVIASVQKGEQT